VSRIDSGKKVAELSAKPIRAIQDQTHRLENLLRQILIYVEKEAGATDDVSTEIEHGYNQDDLNGPEVQDGGTAAEELLEVEIDGSRYALMRWARAPVADHNALSPREQEIVRLVAKGLPNKAIASVLEISAWTVATHLRRIFAKLEVNSRAEMVARAFNSDHGGMPAEGSTTSIGHVLPGRINPANKL
jgi:DNA-binding CsgD family transcriptional regulator